MLRGRQASTQSARAIACSSVRRLMLPSWPKLSSASIPPRSKARCQSRTGIVVQQQSLRDALAAPALVEKDNGVRPPGDAMLRKPVSREPDQSPTVVGRKKSAANHAHEPNPIRLFRQAIFGYSMSRGIVYAG